MAFAFVRARIDEKVRDDAAEVLAEFGLTVSDVVRMTLTRVAKDRAVPLELKLPNKETQSAMQESRAMMKKRAARFRHAADVFKALDGSGKR